MDDSGGIERDKNDDEERSSIGADAEQEPAKKKSKSRKTKALPSFLISVTPANFPNFVLAEVDGASAKTSGETVTIATHYVIYKKTREPVTAENTTNDAQEETTAQPDDPFLFSSSDNENDNVHQQEPPPPLSRITAEMTKDDDSSTLRKPCASSKHSVCVFGNLKSSSGQRLIALIVIHIIR